jgi:hypothetical protein
LFSTVASTVLVYSAAMAAHEQPNASTMALHERSQPLPLLVDVLVISISPSG